MDSFCARYMFLGLRTDGSVVNYRTAGYSIRTPIDRDGGIDKVAVCVRVAEALFSKLAGRTSDSVVMAFDARCSVENRPQSSARIVSPFKLRLIQSEGVAGRLSYAVTDALRAGIRRYFACWADSLSERGSSKPGWRLSLGLLRDEGNCGGSDNN